MSQPDKPASSPAPAEPTETSRDLGERIVRSLAAERKEPGRKLADEEARAVTPEPDASRPAMPFRPTARPPIAMLTVCDDGRNDGEMIRIRGHRFVIGRTEGDLKLPIDGRMSARHVEITLQTIAGKHHRWVVTDLQSTHGLFVRVSRVRLADTSEFLVGGGRYLFEAAARQGETTAESLSKEDRFATTHDWAESAPASQAPALTELIGNQIGNRVLLEKPEYWIGSDPSCEIRRAADPFCEPRHVRVYRDSRGQWHAENNKTANGLWARMPQVVVDSLVQFQIGEQRFRLRVG